MKHRLVFAASVLAVSLAQGGNAFAQAQVASGSAGPVSVPNVPVQLCVGSTCQQTPPLSSVGLSVMALTDATAVPPTMQSGSCASGTGVALVVRGGSTGAILAGTLRGTRPDGSAYEQPIGPPVNLAPGATLTISACAPAFGAPLLSGLMGSLLSGGFLG